MTMHLDSDVRNTTNVQLQYNSSIFHNYCIYDCIIVLSIMTTFSYSYSIPGFSKF